MPVLVERDGRVLVIEIQREEKRNAIDPDLTTGIDAAINELEDDPELWVGIITGGTSVFSAGSDLRLTGGPPTPRGGEYGVIRRARETAHRRGRRPCPRWGNGDRARLRSRHRFALGQLRSARDQTGSARALWRCLPRSTRVAVEHRKGSRAHRRPHLGRARCAFGFVNVLCANGEALAEAKKLAARIVVNAPVSVRESLRVVERSVGAFDDLAWATTKEAARAVWASDDSREGREAFLEKRAPVWRNH